ncbi:PPOX class F420-dependent oxidoreductase [Nonomuraea sp. NPDC050790]|uniref:PPOX class F420-dependent oxidoreductase n=1 Tax=Nonomuraea sp. NPDC050790 TaxID=3364371 RepID=UPI0037A7E170
MNLGDEQYVSVTSYKRDGTPVATPVWCARDGEAVVIWTVADSWKVKRIRANPRVSVAPCDLRGRVSGPAVEGKAEILSAGETERVRAMLRRKYGLIGRITLLGSRLRRGATGTLGIRITDI